ncbi:MAG: hypothetical protein P9L97_02155 [Candidatus Tenebribacter davisii]|jgi:glucose uptake protein GlcU|nr:hypothetical protein [Candidatus Tenebribacter davisii]
MKVLKFIFNFLVVSVIGYIAYNIYQLLKGLIELDKTLPQYLGNIVGEIPVVSITAAFNKITITIKYSKAVIKKNETLKEIITDYVTDFYPIFKAKNITVLIEELKETPKPKDKK